MKTWLFTWNPILYKWDDLLVGWKELKNDISQIGFSIVKWTCGVNKSIQSGDRIFLIRLGQEPRGMVASGYAISAVFKGNHWDVTKMHEGKSANRIFVSFDDIRVDGDNRIINMETLKTYLSHINGQVNVQVFLFLMIFLRRYI